MPIVTTSAFSLNTEYEVRAKGYRGTAAASILGVPTVTNVDCPIGAEDRYLNGVALLLVGHAEADTMRFQIVDVDGVMAPAGTVLKQFGDTWNVDHTSSDQGRDVFSFLARIYAGLYIRIVYTSTGLVPVIVKLNVRLYKKVA